jgi:hypothetical protein
MELPQSAVQPVSRKRAPRGGGNAAAAAATAPGSDPTTANSSPAASSLGTPPGQPQLGGAGGTSGFAASALERLQVHKTCTFPLP